ncbi:MAG TPA: hypothetical protein VNI77_12500 [Nitrososphaera sp.]|nr:hypothetical protein [Nitrososphaera sp.]
MSAAAKPKRPSRQTVVIYEDIHKKAKAKAEQKKMTLQDYVNEVLLMNIEKDEFLKDYAPSLSLDAMTETSLFIKDARKDRTAEVVIKDSQLVCYLDESNDCDHVHFALALPELGKLNIKRPQKSR